MQKNKIEENNTTLNRTNDELNYTNEELNLTNEELHTTLETVSKQKDKITKQRDDIEKQKIEMEKLSIVANKTDNSVIIADATGEIEWVNDGFTRLLGTSFEEFKKDYGSNIYKTSLNPEIEKIIHKSIKNKESVVYTNNTITKNNKEIWIQTTLTPIFGKDNKLTKLVAIDSDITNIKKAEQKITEHRDELHIKNKHITDSINYARRIQTAALPSKKMIDNILPEHFILFKPRDIVSGDFYWVQKMNGHIMIAVADCTGHGVPGAFMSMLGISFLNEIVRKQEIIHANKILDELRNQIKTTLDQTGKKNETKDGMDIAFCVINKKTNKLQFSGAHLPIYIIRNTINSPNVTITTFPTINVKHRTLDSNNLRLTQIQANFQPIGVFIKEKPFTCNEIQLFKNDKLYLFSDGFIDQRGGSENKKFMSRNFKKLLLDNCTKSMNQQHAILDKVIVEWTAEFKQVDDILVVGITIG